MKHRTPRPIPLRATLAALAVGALAAPAALAGLQQEQFPTQFTKYEYKVSNGEATFKGKIDSADSGCVKGRKVKLIRKHNGNEKKLGDDKADSKGKFSIDGGSFPPKDGKYYAEVKEITIGSGENEAICLAKTSASIKLSS